MSCPEDPAAEYHDVWHSRRAPSRRRPGFRRTLHRWQARNATDCQLESLVLSAYGW